MHDARHGQIIGLKMREREAEKREREAATSRKVLEDRIGLVIRTLRSAFDEDDEASSELLAWAADQLEEALRGGGVQPFDDAPPSE